MSSEDLPKDSSPPPSDVPDFVGNEDKTPTRVTTSVTTDKIPDSNELQAEKFPPGPSNKIPPRRPFRVGRSSTSSAATPFSAFSSPGTAANAASGLGIATGVSTGIAHGSAGQRRGRHRRVLSAVEGSVAQELLLTGMGNLDLSGLNLGGGVDLGMEKSNINEADIGLNETPSKTRDGIDGPTSSDTNVDASPNSNLMSALSQWNNAAQIKAGPPSPPPTPPTRIQSTPNTSTINVQDSYLNDASTWDPNDDDDGLVLPIHTNGPTGNPPNHTNTNSSSSHHQFPILPIPTDGSSVGATAAFSSSSQRSIMSQYSSDLEEDEDKEKEEDLLGEEGDLMGELLPDIDQIRSRKTPTSSTLCKNCTRMQQIEHQRRMQNETKKISSRNIAQPTSPKSSHSPISSSLKKNSLTTLQSKLHDVKTDIQSQNQIYFEKILSFLQSESQRRNAIEHRLHSQLLLQSESMVAMELKLLRLEAKVERREKQRRQLGRRGSGTNTSLGSGVAASASTPGRGMAGGPASSGGIASSGSFRRLASPAIEVETDGFPLEANVILANVEETMEDDEDDSDDSNDGESKNSDEDESDAKESPHQSKKVLKKIVAASSGASLVSAVTAMSGEGFGLEEEDQDGQGGESHSRTTLEEGEEEGVESLTIGSSSIIERTYPGTWSRGRGRNRGVRAVVTGIATEDDGSVNTPPQSSNRNIPNLESILLNPLVLNNSVSNLSITDSMAPTTRAVRGPHDLANGVEDENSTLATSVTSATWTSTVVTGATSILNANTSRGGSLITGAIGEHSSYTDNTHDDNDQSSKEVIHISLKEEEDEVPRNLSSSPLTIPSMSGMASIASSVNSAFAMGSVSTTAAVAPSRDFRSRRALVAAQRQGTNNSDGIIPSHVKTVGNNTIVNTEAIEEEEITSTRSRSNSPLTLPSMSGVNSVAPSLSGTSITANSVATLGTTGAVAPSRDFRSRRATAAAQLAASAVNERTGSASVTSQPSSLILGGGGGGGFPRPLTNRVVSFVHAGVEESIDENGSENMEGAQVVFSGGTGILRGEADSLTVPDELDNLSDIDTAFASTSARWREEYEARLDAIQKRWSGA